MKWRRPLSPGATGRTPFDMSLDALSLPDFAAFLRERGIRRFALVTRDGGVSASHEAVASLADAMANNRVDYDGHEGFFAELCPQTGVLFGACIHRTCRGQGAGGVRNWRYDTVGDFLRDGMRLAQGMTLKNALAGLWWGGGKGLIAARGLQPDPSSPAVRREIYTRYGDFMSSLRGCYVTAEDVGTSVEDMAAIFSRTRFTTCIPAELGGSGNPSAPTALGVVRGMEAALAHRDMGTLEGKTIAVQGLGHVGEPLVDYLHQAGVARVVGSDIDPAAAQLADKYARLEVHVAERGDEGILATQADIVAPCAVGGVLHERTIAALSAPIVCGAANNQLRDPAADGARLHARGITYVPDFLVNRMGIVNCADEAAGYVDDDPRYDDHLGRQHDNSVYRLTLQVLERAASEDRAASDIALELATERSFELHPIFGHRGRRIIESLMARGWAD